MYVHKHPNHINKIPANLYPTDEADNATNNQLLIMCFLAIYYDNI